MARVYQLAKELNVQSALILELLDRLGKEVRSDLSPIDDQTAELVRSTLTAALDVEKKRLAEERKRVAEEQPLVPEPIVEPIPVEAPIAAAEVASPIEEAPAMTPAEPSGEPDTAVDAPTIGEPAESLPPPIAAGAVPSPIVMPPPAVPTADVAVPPAVPAAASPMPPPPPPVPGVPGRRIFAAKRTVPVPVIGRGAPMRPGAGRPVPGGRTDGTMPRPGVPPRPGAPAPAPGAAPAPSPVGARPKEGGRPGHATFDREARRKGKGVEAPPPPSRPKPDLPPVPERITLSEAVTVKELAEKLNRKSKDVIAKLMGRGILANINQPLDPEMAITIAKEFGSEATIISFEEEVQLVPEPTSPVEVAGGLQTPRPPVVTVMGHVDHGKTSLLDAIRTTNVVAQEHGGITQHIGAYQVTERGRKITFLDTPGHEAFTMMRARGARVTDIVVLVVAADDGVKPQTLEAIDHAKAAGVPIVVAINKVDKPDARPDRVKQQLADRDLLVEEYGGKTVCCEISAKKRQGIEELLEMILLVADIQDLKADAEKQANGIVLEARLDRARGIVATILVQSGTLRVGDPFIAGSAFGKVRAMTDENGRRVDHAGPSTPVEVMGFQTEPTAGDSLQAVADEVKARQIAQIRQEKARVASLVKSSRRTLESLSKEIAEGQIKELSILVKADVQGSVEALQKSIGEMPQDKVRVSILRATTGAITPADVMLAAASNAIVVGFNVRPDRATVDLARQEEVEIRLYNIIYDVVNDLKAAMVGMLEPTLKENVLGQAEVRQLFRVPKVGVIAGCMVTDGMAKRTADVRLIRDNVVVYTGKVGSLRRFKDDASEVKSGFECGVGIANFNDLKEGDVIEFFTIEKVAVQSL